jgi:transposase
LDNLKLPGIKERGEYTVLNFQLNLSKKQMQDLANRLEHAEKIGNVRETKRCLAIIAITEGQDLIDVSEILQVTPESVQQWLKKFLTTGINSLITAPVTGRPTKLTEAQRIRLSEIIKAGPGASGFPGACWRTPMIKFLIEKIFKVSYSVKYLSELLKHIGFSYQKATFVAAKRDEELRQIWLKETWPEILKLSQKKNAKILFGDEASFPQWGTLNYTWAPIGEQPVVQTSGNRKSYKVFGLIDFYTGSFYSKGHEEKLNSESYMEFLEEVLSKTRQHIILVQDGAPYHKSAMMKVFFKKHSKRITVYQLPTFSPDYNPIEKLWKKIKQAGIHLQYFPTFDSLVLKVEEMMDFFGNVKKEVLSLFGLYDELVFA